MIEALLYQVRVKMLSKTLAEITLVPTWLGRWFKRRVRQGIAYRAKDTGNVLDRGKGVIGWWWKATDRYVGDYIERYIEAAPILVIEDMTIEQLLLDEPTPTKRTSTP
jgi:hypothetical protein